MAEPQVFGVDYNSIRNKVEDILGTTGTATSGYGQVLLSEPVSPGETITKSQWDNLSYDIVSVRLHQTGSIPAIASIVPGSIIYGNDADNPNINYNDIIELGIEQRLSNAVGRTAVSAQTSQTNVGSWSGSATSTLTVTFPGYTRISDGAIISGADHARFFFNSGGKIRFTSTRTGGTVSTQNTSWTSLLNTAGTVVFEAFVPGVASFYSLTDSFEGPNENSLVYEGTASSSYADNTYSVRAKCNIADNSLGGATIVTFLITWQDDYVDPDTLNPDYPGPGTSFAPSGASGDLIDGTLSIVIEESKIAGDRAPSGSFEMTSPLYSITPISTT